MVNPVLRFELERRYSVHLPETWPLNSIRQGTSIRSLLNRQKDFQVDSGSLTLTTIAYRSSALLRDYQALIDRIFDEKPGSAPDPSAPRHLVLPPTIPSWR